MVQHDSTLGWKLTPNWQGKHHHHDFDASYRINELGFRADSGIPTQRTGKLVAVVGDSFTFGLGVNDNETFVHLLNQQSTNHFINCGIPGYSTDQELLLIEKRIIPELKPDVILLVVYLGNDLFDNQLPYPLQVNSGKPMFAFKNGALMLENVPVPQGSKPPQFERTNLMMMAVGDAGRNDLFHALERKSEVLRSVAQYVVSEKFSHSNFVARSGPALELFVAILDRIRLNCEAANIELMVAVLAGRSHSLKPTSLSAGYQESLRLLVMNSLKMKCKQIDLADALRKNANSHCFYQYDGHLTSAGHRFVGTRLREQLENRPPQ